MEEVHKLLDRALAGADAKAALDRQVWIFEELEYAGFFFVYGGRGPGDHGAVSGVCCQ